MLKKFFTTITKSGILYLFSFVLIIAVFFSLNFTQKTQTYKELINPRVEVPASQISGWIAWWKEEDAYKLAATKSAKLKTVSPVWFMVDQNTKISETGNVDKIQTAKNLKKLGIFVYPSLGSEIPGKNLGNLLRDSKKVNELIDNLIVKLKLLEVDGLDVDLEGIEKKDKDSYTLVLTEFSKKIKQNNLNLSITIHAQTGSPIWDGTSGQDLDKIGKIADEVRIMLYDEHSPGGSPGPIASYKWMEDVVKYISSKIPQEKIIIGIPSYGYLWTKDETKGLQYNEFYQALLNKKYTQTRDPLSGELKISGKDFTGWLSDSNAMISKVNLLRELGFNRFIIWHLSGMDVNFFDLL